MTYEQSIEIIREYRRANNLKNLRSALDQMCIYKHKLPIKQYVAVDRFIYGYSDYEHLLAK